MAFPDLQLVPNPLDLGENLPNSAQATGVPDAGNNTFALPFVDAGIDPDLVDPRRFQIHVEYDPDRPVGGSLEPGVSDAKYVSLSPDKRDLTISFAQANPGVGTVRLTVSLVHTIQGVGSAAFPLIVGGAAAPASGGGAGLAELTRSYVPGVLVNDVVYETAVASTVDRADASAVATANALGFVKEIDSPGVGQCLVVPVGADLDGFVGLTPGAQYVLASGAPGQIVEITDTLNPNYPDYLTPGSGEALVPVGIAKSATELAANTTPGIQAVG